MLRLPIRVARRVVSLSSRVASPFVHAAHGGSRTLRLALAGLVVASACGGDSAPADANRDSATGGTVLIGLIGEPKTLLPPLVSSEHEQAVMEVLHDRLADIAPTLDVDDDRGFTPRLASAWTWANDSLSIRFTLDPRARWHDGTPVTGADVARTYALYTNPAVGSYVANLLANIDSVTTPDAATATFWFRRRAPQQFYDAVHHMCRPSRARRSARDGFASCDGRRMVASS